MAIREIRVKKEARSAKARRIADERRAWENTDKLLGTNGTRQAEMAAREQLRSWYAAQVRPRLTELQPKDIARAIEVSRVYARQLIAGQIPHRRHFAALAELAGVPAPGVLRALTQATGKSEQSVPDIVR
jgi:hypothetical protein